MFGYDMSWASFHVLEVMSSAKYLQKRVGYLGAVQSFRPDTEVLMLATNLLKKDIVTSSIPNMSLPLITLPHIITPSLAMSLLPDLLSRLSHSSPVVRKKTIVCLYRLALVYPEALKLAWPKIKDHLMDDQEDGSVTTAAINVVCELGWRRPHDFLPLAPRLFELLVDSGNNWMAIKIIKLFATLTPLEPRLTRKLLRPLTNIIQTTSAMSLLYECINGIIQGGILDGEENLQERDEVATLCVGKLRGMIVMDSDPNLKYVALLALNRIVATHPTLVSMQQDVIMDCLDDADVSIRLQALELAVGMVSSDSLQLVVNRLLGQLQQASIPAAELVDTPQTSEHPPNPTLWPSDYQTEVVHRILDLCSQKNYSEIVDFEWYVAVLVQLVGLLPPLESEDDWGHPKEQEAIPNLRMNAALRIGTEIRNVAVRVKGVRMEATRAAESLMFVDNRSTFFPSGSTIGDGVLGPVAWVVGEYAEYLLSPNRTLLSLIDISNASLPPRTLSLFLQAIPKVFVQASQTGQPGDLWKSEMSLLLARVVEFLEALAAHPDLDVQERAIEFLEVLRLASEALSSDTQEVPFLLASVIPNLFTGLELNPVATSAQRKVVLPDSLRLEEAFGHDLLGLFRNLDGSSPYESKRWETSDFYHLPELSSPNKQTRDLALIDFQPHASYQNFTSAPVESSTALQRRMLERRERFKDDPFYIAPSGDSSGTSTPFHEALNISNGEVLDIDSIPIVDLKLGDEQLSHVDFDRQRSRRPVSKLIVAGDETFEAPNSLTDNSRLKGAGDDHPTYKRSLLQVDSSSLGHLSLEKGPSPQVPTDEGDTEMARAMQQVEEVRLRMQRASERIQLEGIPAEGTLVKKKKKTKKHVAPDRDVGPGLEGPTEPATGKKKRKKKTQEPEKLLEN
ncbi:Armadillo-like helical [Penicillium griseofulvum]|uniref:AP-3 complex subunit delta n=1 Tax=Penicillium patulum TaxID=5078 RepID=A0A135LQZ5_PENPA|nr:Armadillo-like helical [Penicillium griseofulvum]KXG51380.1 Armadillo-like helical [Penicillium griseofulvum]